MGNIIQSIPEAKLLLASLRSVGYTEETAIADIVDNCISAKAKFRLRGTERGDCPVPTSSAGGLSPHPYQHKEK